MNAGTPALPELAEADSPADIREIFAEIRQWTGGPIVALIFRNLATTPGMLEEVWGAIGPLFRTGQMQEAAWRVTRETVRADILPPIEAHARAVIGLTDAAHDSLRNLFDAYNRANPVNLLSMLSLLARLRGDRQARPVIATGWAPPRAIVGALPSMTPLDIMAPEVRRLINDFGFGDRVKLDPVVPSLYRHLTGWPGYLGVLHVTLVPRFRDGSIVSMTQQLHQSMAKEAESIADFLPPLPHLAAAPHVSETLAQFTTSIIPSMIVVGHALRAAVQ